jgi:hypothetical protein
VHEGGNDDMAAFSPDVPFVWYKQLSGSSWTNDLQLAASLAK